jgi:hypothetical protein
MLSSLHTYIGILDSSLLANLHCGLDIRIMLGKDVSRGPTTSVTLQ